MHFLLPTLFSNVRQYADKCHDPSVIYKIRGMLTNYRKDRTNLSKALTPIKRRRDGWKGDIIIFIVITNEICLSCQITRNCAWITYSRWFYIHRYTFAPVKTVRNYASTHSFCEFTLAPKHLLFSLPQFLSISSPLHYLKYISAFLRFGVDKAFSPFKLSINHSFCMLTGYYFWQHRTIKFAYNFHISQFLSTYYPFAYQTNSIEANNRNPKGIQ